jgi:hypothetical protein
VLIKFTPISTLHPNHWQWQKQKGL